VLPCLWSKALWTVHKDGLWTVTDPLKYFAGWAKKKLLVKPRSTKFFHPHAQSLFHLLLFPHYEGRLMFPTLSNVQPIWSSPPKPTTWSLKFEPRFSLGLYLDAWRWVARKTKNPKQILTRFILVTPHSTPLHSTPLHSTSPLSHTHTNQTIN
jgi:hypothetical protein